MTPINRKVVKIKQFQKDVMETLTYQDVVTFAGKGEVVKIEGRNNQDGTQDVTYFVKVDLSDIKKADFETSKPVSIVDDYHIKEKSRSQAIRHKAFTIAEEHGTSEESLYNSAMDEADRYLNEWSDEQRLEGISD